MEKLTTIENNDIVTQAEDQMKIENNFKTNYFMLPETFSEIPETFEENWLALPWIDGVRCLLIASNGITIAKNYDGNVFLKFNSNLPNGNPSSKTAKSNYTIIDCIFINNIIYAIDLLVWKGNYYYDSDSEFRFYWRNTKLQEEIDLKEITATNEYSITNIPYYKCDIESLKEIINTKSLFTGSGWMFYHKAGHYFPGQCPLMSYLSPANSFLNVINLILNKQQ